MRQLQLGKPLILLETGLQKWRQMEIAKWQPAPMRKNLESWWLKMERDRPERSAPRLNPPAAASISLHPVKMRY
jgi:hypothetical protein